MDELRAKIAAADWRPALVLGLSQWRDTRWPVLADLIDRLAVLCPMQPAPRRVQPWWMPRALRYQPFLVTELMASATRLAQRSDTSWEDIAKFFPALATRLVDAIADPQAEPFRGIVSRNLVARLGAMMSWPEDPRVARVIAGWLCEAKVAWAFPYDGVALALYEAMADELVRLRDPRVIPELEACIAEPRGKTVGIREKQRELAGRVIDSLAASVLAAPPLDDVLADEIARWCPRPHTATAIDETALWRDAITDDARLVLADYLLERGDRRGEVITLALSGDDNARRSSALLHEHWDRWMGELALVLDRGNCTFSGGLLHTATIGVFSTPEWAYAKVARHRELASMRCVRPGWNASERGYVAFLRALETIPPRVRLHLTMIRLLPRTPLPVRAVELVANLYDLNVPIRDVMERALPLFPDVEEIEFALPGEIDLALVAELPRLRAFAKLARVRVDAARVLPADVRAALRALQLPWIEIDHGTF